jgi:hypothetical protein
MIAALTPTIPYISLLAVPTAKHKAVSAVHAMKAVLAVLV